MQGEAAKVGSLGQYSSLQLVKRDAETTKWNAGAERCRRRTDRP